MNSNSSVVHTANAVQPNTSSTEQLAACLKSLRKVRGAATCFFTTLSQFYSLENTKENNTSNVVAKKKDHNELDAMVQTELEDLLRNTKLLQIEVSSLSPQLNSNMQSNLDLLSLDPGMDKQHLHHKLRQCYIWMDKVHNYSSMSHSLMTQSQLNRSHTSNHWSSSKRRRPPPTSYNVNIPQQQVDNLILAINNQFQDMSLNVTRPMGTNAIVQVTLGRVLRGVLVLRGLLIEGVVIRGYDESNLDKKGNVDIFTQSNLVVYQRVTDNACAAMLHFCSPYFVDLSIRSFFTWLHSYNNLFSQPCTKCGYTISNCSPPTWRQFRTLLPYHQHCRP